MFNMNRNIAFGRKMALGFTTKQARFLSDSLKQEIQKTLDSNKVVVFMKGNKTEPKCGFSKAVVQILEIQGVKEFKTIDILQDEDMRQGIKDFTSWPTIPQVFIKGEFIGGCDIMINMHQSGELEGVLLKEGILKD